MTPKTLLCAVLLLTGLFASAQQQVGSSKLFIINDSSRATLLNAQNPAAALAQTDRVELTARDALVNVQRCSSTGCVDPVGKQVHIEAINKVNSDVGATSYGGDGHCRFCMDSTQSIPTNLEDYVDRIKATAPQFER